MKIKRIIKTSWHNLIQRKRSSFMAILGIIIGIAALTALWGIIEGVKKNVVSNLAQVIAPDELIITQKYEKIYFILEKEAKSEVPMNDEFVEKLRQRDDVVSVYPETAVVEQATAYVDFQGMTFELDAPVFGIDPAYFSSFKEFGTYDPASDDDVPVLLSKRLIDIYNLSFGNTDQFYRLNPEAFINFEFLLKVGYSSFFKEQSPTGVKEIHAQLVGWAENVPTAGVMVPESVARSLNEYFTGVTEENYSRILVKVKDPKYVPDVAEFAESQEFAVNSLQNELTRFNNLVNMILITLSVVIFIILLVSAFNIYNTLHAAVLERSTEIGLWKALGARNTTIARIYLIEALIMGSVGAILGMAIGVGIGVGIAAWLEVVIPDISLLSKQFISYEWYMFVAGFIVSLCISGIAGVGPARKAARLYPIEVLRG